MLGLLTFTLLGLFAALPARGSEPRIYLSSHAPYGHAGADSSLVWAKGDTSRVDTLYLTFDPGRACSTFVAMTAKVWIHALGEDSLSAFWAAGEKQSPPPWIKVEYGRGAGWDPPFPWQDFGTGVAGYARPSPRAGLLVFAYAVAAGSRTRVAAGQPYSFARVILTRPAAGTTGRDHPVCFEWLEAGLSFSLRESGKAGDGARYVGLNAAAGSYGCDTSPESPARPATHGVWKPPRGK